MALHNNTDGNNWNLNVGWLVGSDPCSWIGVICEGGRVTELNLDQNNLSGPIPSELGNLTALSVLNLGDNQLSGPIPAELGNLTGLVSFRLNINDLSGLVPPSVATRGAVIQQITALGRCSFDSNPGLFMPNSQDYMDADLDNDGFICGIPLGTPSS